MPSSFTTYSAYLRRLIGEDWPSLHRSLVDAYRKMTTGGWSRLGLDHHYMWLHLSHHLHEAGLADELAELLAAPTYIMRKAVAFGHESLVADKAVIERMNRADTVTWRTAQALTRSGYLLHGLTSKRDIAGTLLVVLARARGEPAAIEQLHLAVEHHGFAVQWATTEATDTDWHIGAVYAVSARGDAVVSAGEDGVVRLWDSGSDRPVRHYRGHTGLVYAVAISPDGETIASGRRCHHSALVPENRRNHRHPPGPYPTHQESGIHLRRPTRVRC